MSRCRLAENFWAKNGVFSHRSRGGRAICAMFLTIFCDFLEYSRIFWIILEYSGVFSDIFAFLKCDLRDSCDVEKWIEKDSSVWGGQVGEVVGAGIYLGSGRRGGKQVAVESVFAGTSVFVSTSASATTRQADIRWFSAFFCLSAS